jgi:hypothetical protein
MKTKMNRKWKHNETEMANNEKWNRERNENEMLERKERNINKTKGTWTIISRSFVQQPGLPSPCTVTTTRDLTYNLHSGAFPLAQHRPCWMLPAEQAGSAHCAARNAHRGCWGDKRQSTIIGILWNCRATQHQVRGILFPLAEVAKAKNMQLPLFVCMIQIL